MLKTKKKLRRALTSEDFDSPPGGTPIDCPKLPATILLDDINEVIVEMQDFGPENYCYKVTSYPPSHH